MPSPIERELMPRGQSLLEVLIAMGIAVIFFIGAAVLVAPTLQINKNTEQVQVNVASGETLLEHVRVWADGNWNNILSLATGTAYRYYLNTSSSPFTLASPVVQSTSSVAISGVCSNHIDCFVSFDKLVKKGDLVVASFYFSPNTQNGALGGASDTLSTPFWGTTTYIGSSTFYTISGIAPANGTDTIHVAAPSSITSVILFMNEISGVASPSPFDISTGASGHTTSATDGNTSGLATPHTNGDLIYGNIQDNSGVDPLYNAGTGFATIENGTSSGGYAWNIELKIQPSAGPVAATWTANGNSGNYTAQMIAFQLQAVYPYFYVSDVYRDGSGNATSTAAGNTYDPSTKLVTVVYGTPGGLVNSLYEYLTRNRAETYLQSNWSGGPGLSGPVTTTNSQFSTSTRVDYFDYPGSLQLLGN